MEHLTFLFGNTTFAFCKPARSGRNVSNAGDDNEFSGGTANSHLSVVGPTNRFSFISELVVLFRLLICKPGWREAVASTLFSELSQLPSRLPVVFNLVTSRCSTPRVPSSLGNTAGPASVRCTTPRLSGNSTPLPRGSLSLGRQYLETKESIRQLGAALAAIYVYGGHIEGVRIGAQVLVLSGTKVSIEGKISALPCNCRGVIVSLTSAKAHHVVVSPNNDFRSFIRLNKKEQGQAHPLFTVSVHKLHFEESSEPSMSPLLLNNESIVTFSYLLNTQPCLDLVDGSLMETMLVDKQGVFDALLIASHVRTRALLALSRQVKYPAPALAALQGGLLPALLSLAVTDVETVVGVALGKEVSTLKKMPLLAALIATLSKPTFSVQDLQLFSLQVWSRFPDTSPLSRSPWWLGNISSMQRGKQAIEVLGGEVMIEGWRIRAKSQFPTVRLSGVSLGKGQGVDRGMWFFEATLLSEGLMQIGWADSNFVCDPIRGQGVGDHAHSWAYDGYRQKKWSVSSQTYGDRWRIGDTVGVLIDLDLVEMRFFINGKDLGPAFVGFQADGLYPALSLNSGQACRFNFGQSQFLFPPPFTFTPICEAASVTTIMTPTKINNLSSQGQDDDSSRLDSRRRAEEEPDEEMATEIEMRRQALVENLIGMGFPVEWAIRAAEHCDASLNESVAIAWIIERMEMENAKLEAEAEAEAAGEGLDQGGEDLAANHPSEAGRYSELGEDYEGDGEDDTTEGDLSFRPNGTGKQSPLRGASAKLTSVAEKADGSAGGLALIGDDSNLVEDDAILGCSGTGGDASSYFLPEGAAFGSAKEGEDPKKCER